MTESFKWEEELIAEEISYSKDSDGNVVKISFKNKKGETPFVFIGHIGLKAVVNFDSNRKPRIIMEFR